MQTFIYFIIFNPKVIIVNTKFIILKTKILVFTTTTHPQIFASKVRVLNIFRICTPFKYPITSGIPLPAASGAYSTCKKCSI